MGRISEILSFFFNFREHRERASWTWEFSALDTACEACRALNGEKAPYRSKRYRYLESLEHGCMRGKECECGCVMFGIGVGTGPAEIRQWPPDPTPGPGVDDLLRTRSLHNKGNFDEALRMLRSSMAKGCRQYETALYLRRFGERAEAAGDKVAALSYYREALAIEPKIGIKRHASALEKEVGR